MTIGLSTITNEDEAERDRSQLLLAAQGQAGKNDSISGCRFHSRLFPVCLSFRQALTIRFHASKRPYAF
jgi:hypothetical protein